MATVDGNGGTDGAGTPQRRNHRGTGTRTRWFSWLTSRVIAINLLPVVILFSGVIHLDRYQDSLIEAELRAMSQQATVLSRMMGVITVGPDERGGEWLNTGAIHHVMYRYVSAAPHRVEVFDRGCQRVADSYRLPPARGTLPRGVVQTLPLLPPSGRLADVIAARTQMFYQVADWLPRRGEMPRYVETSRDPIIVPDVRKALGGHSVQSVSATDTGGLMLTVAMPIRKYKRIQGALLLSLNGATIDKNVRSVRAEIIVIFLIVFAATLALSIYQAGTITRPIQRLARAAEQVRDGRNRQYSIPEFPGLRDEISNLATTLREMTETLWQRIDATEQFAAEVAHELKNPLASVHSAVETALIVDDPVRRKKLFAIILDDVSRLDRLISDISRASRVDAELSRGSAAPVDIGRLVAGLCDAYVNTGQTGAIELHCEIGTGVSPRVSGNEASLGQVFRNLIDNALTFSRPGGQIRIRVEAFPDTAVVTVDDDGVGIPEGKLEEIFERFYTERPASEKFGAHSGLGLSLSRQIVKAHDGSIVATNRTADDGRLLGARFAVTLPLAGAAGAGAGRRD